MAAISTENPFSGKHTLSPIVRSHGTLLCVPQQFQIIGSLAPANRAYFRRLQQMIETYGLCQTVTLTPNASNKELIGSMSKSMIYLHTMIGEHFGVSIVEAMAAGLVPIVPAYGGCSEIVPTDHQYNTLEQAADKIAKNAKYADDEKRVKMHEISRRFSPDNFRKAMSVYIDQARSQIGTYRTSCLVDVYTHC